MSASENIPKFFWHVRIYAAEVNNQHPPLDDIPFDVRWHSQSTLEMEDLFIELVRENKPIYDKQHRSYKDRMGVVALRSIV